MTHDEAYDRLAALVELRIAHPIETEVQAHVATCAVCAERLRDLDNVTRALQIAANVRSDRFANLEERVLAIPSEYPQRPAGWVRRRLLPTGVGLAAAASLAALVLVLWGPRQPSDVAHFEAERTITLQPVRAGVFATLAVGRQSGATRVVRLDVRGLPTSGSRSFDLWLVGSTGATRAGSFGPEDDGTCIVDLTTPGDAQWDRVAITPAGAGPRDEIIARS